MVQRLITVLCSVTTRPFQSVIPQTSTSIYIYIYITGGISHTGTHVHFASSKPMIVCNILAISLANPEQFGDVSMLNAFPDGAKTCSHFMSHVGFSCHASCYCCETVWKAPKQHWEFNPHSFLHRVQSIFFISFFMKDERFSK